MSWIDWTLVAAFVAALCAASAFLSRVSKSVADFMAAGRCAGRYLLSMANDMGGFAAIFVVATFEQFYVSGFPGAWWSILFMPMWAIIMVTGWIQFRFRETRALTMPHFFEMRYGPKLRVFAGFLAFLAGVLNYGIFPGVTANLIVSFGGLPQELLIAGITVPTQLPVMIAILAIAMWVLLSGGLVSVMVTDFLQGLLVMLGTVVLGVTILWFVGWGTLFEGVTLAEEGRSKLDPFDQGEIRSFNVWFFAILAVNRFYSFMAFPTRQGYDAAAFSPDEARFSRMLGDGLFNLRNFVLMLLPIGAWVIMHHADFGGTAAAVNQQLAQIDDEQVRTQMTVPTVLAAVFPVGLMGLFVAMMVGAAISTDNTFVHSWGGILVHDVIEPARGKKLSEKAKLRALRLAMLGVAVFAVLWSLFFPVQEYIFMYFAITSSIYVAGAGALVIGGLYWSRGTVQGAWAALIVGLALSLGGLVLRTAWPWLPVPDAWGDEFPVDGIRVFFFSILASVAAYVVTSLVTCREPVDLDEMLHRSGSETPTPKAEAAKGMSPAASKPRRGWPFKLKKASPRDRWTTIIYLGLTGACVVVFLVGNAVGAFVDIPDAFWSWFWQGFVALMLALLAAALGTFLIGGANDIRRLAAALKEAGEEDREGASRCRPRRAADRRRETP